MSEVIVGVDGSSHSIRAPEWVMKVAALRRAAEEPARKAASQSGDAQPTSAGVRAATGFPANELIEAPRDAGLVVVGSCGAGGFARMVVGSVSGQVVQHAHCPVVVVHGEK